MRQPRGREGGRAPVPSEGCLVDHPVAIGTELRVQETTPPPPGSRIMGEAFPSRLVVPGV